MTDIRPCLTLLDATGDTTIIWDDDTEDRMLAIIEQKMKDGFNFYIMKARPFPFLRPRQAKASDIAEVRAAGSVVVRDEQLEALFLEGKLDVVKTPGGTVETVGRAKTAREVVRNQTVGIRPARGG